MTSVRGDVGWQTNKSLAQCNGYMLDHAIASDVTFIIQTPEGVTEDIKAHKYMLISRSPVFEAMFCGDFYASNDKDGKIAITDVNVDTFKDVLRYIYMDEATLSAENVLPVMYAAKKYLLEDLQCKCREFLKSNISMDNACTIFSQSLLYEEEQLTKKSTAYILEHAKDIITKEDFLNLSHEALVSVLGRDDIVVDEATLFQSCVKWAENGLQRAGTTITDAEIRRVLGSALYLIRFPLMEITEFADNAGRCAILTEEEKSKVYYYLAATDGILDLKCLTFNAKPRECTVAMSCKTFLRFEEVHKSQAWTCRGKYVDAFTFEIEKSVLFRGISVYGSKNASNASAQIKIYEMATGRLMGSVDKTYTCDGSPNPIPLYMKTSIKLRAYTRYDISLLLKCDDTFRGILGKQAVTRDNITVHFYKSSRSVNNTCVEHGQIPGLLFSVI